MNVVVFALALGFVFAVAIAAVSSTVQSEPEVRATRCAYCWRRATHEVMVPRIAEQVCEHHVRKSARKLNRLT